MSLVSVCVPVYNGEKYLRESLDSIIDQTHKELEILILDDCSTDESIDIIQEYASVDDRIRVIRNDSNLGLVGNWNRCIEEFSGEWMKLHFQDDLMAPQTVAKMLALAEKKQLGVVLTDREYKFEHRVNNFYTDELPKISDYVKQATVVTPQFILGLLKKHGIRMNFMGEPILGLVNKSVYEQIGLYDCSFKQISDFEFWLRIGLSMNIGFIPERLHTFRLHNASQSAKNSEEKEINPSHLDRILLASKLNNDPVYQGLRELAGSTFTEGLIRHFIQIYTKRYTREKLANHISQEYFMYLDRSVWRRLLDRLMSKKS